MSKIWAAIAMAVLLPTVTLAESPLAAAAKRERERREQNKNEGVTSQRVITQDDVKTYEDATDHANAAGGSMTTGSAATATTPATPSAPRMPASPYSTAPRNTSEQYWRSRAREARTRVETARKQLDQLSAVKATKGCVPMIKENPEYVKVEAELKAAEQALADLPEEGRRNGALPGWLR